MHELLQQMKDMHQELHDLDHCEGMFNDAMQWAAKKGGFTTDQERIIKFFKAKSEDEQKQALEDFINTTIHPKDTFDVLAKHINTSVLMNIVEEKTPEEPRSDDKLYAKMKIDPRVKEAKDKFKNFTHEIQTRDLLTILSQIYQNKKTPMDVFNELVQQIQFQREMMKNWPVPKK